MTDNLRKLEPVSEDKISEDWVFNGTQPLLYRKINEIIDVLNALIDHVQNTNP